MNPLTAEEAVWMQRTKRWLLLWRVSETVGIVALASIIGAAIVALTRIPGSGLGWALCISWVVLSVCYGVQRLATHKIRELGDPPGGWREP